MTLMQMDDDSVLAYYETIVTLMYGTEIWDMIKPGFQVGQVLMEHATRLLSKLDLRDWTLDLGSLFEGSEQWERLLGSALDLTPEMIRNLPRVEINMEQVTRGKVGFLT